MPNNLPFLKRFFIPAVAMFGRPLHTSLDLLKMQVSPKKFFKKRSALSLVQDNQCGSAILEVVLNVSKEKF